MLQQLLKWVLKRQQRRPDDENDTADPRMLKNPIGLSSNVHSWPDQCCVDVYLCSLCIVYATNCIQ